MTLALALALARPSGAFDGTGTRGRRRRRRDARTTKPNSRGGAPVITRGSTMRRRFLGSGTYDSFDDADARGEGGDSLDDDDPTRRAFDAAEWNAMSLARRTKDVLKATDSSGIWTVGTTALVFVIAGFESLEAEAVSKGVALEAVLPALVPKALAPALEDGAIENAEQCLQAIFLFEYVVRAWSEEFKLRYLRSPVALIDFLSLLPTFGFILSLVGIGGAGQAATETFRPLRLFRVLRLLRVLDLEGAQVDDGEDAAAKTARRQKTQNEKVIAVAVEFLCVFLISGELFYDLEVDKNPNISDVGDAIYWSFLTLTGIGQPFEAATAEGRVATVVSILTALVVVPLQLAVLVSAQTEAQNQSGTGGAIPKIPPTSAAKIGLAAPVMIPDTPPETDEQFASMTSDVGKDFWLGTMDEDSQWLRIREREELREARKKIRSMEFTISGLREENRKLRETLREVDANVQLELEVEEDIAF